ncbi:MAG: diguanylate cyclase [Gemmatimonadota bacterium]|nr:MAG: diguanylate cyclase [Gemmatimonadota bacterium]
MNADNDTILVIDQDLESQTVLNELVQNMGYDVKLEDDVHRAFHAIEHQEYAVVITDTTLNGYSGLEVLQRTKKYHPMTEVIIVTGQATVDSAVAALNLGANSFIEKPITFSELQIQINQALAKRSFALKTQNLLKESEVLRPDVKKHLHDLIGLSQLSRHLIVSVDYHHIIDTTLRGLEALLPAEVYAILLMSEKEAQLHVRSKESGFETYLPEMKKNLITTWKTLSEKQFNSETIQVYYKAEQLEQQEKVSAGTFNSELCLPLLVQSKVIGLVQIVRASSAAFDADTAQLLTIIADYVATLIDNASKHRHTQLLASTDGFTGLFNHRTIHERLKHELDRSRRYGSPLSLIMLDIDLFKKVNDAYGHLQGDIVLREVADILKTSTREVDLLARYGGDEFVAVLPETQTENGALLAERIRVAVKEHAFHVSDDTIHITISLGVATYPHPDVNTKDDLIERADKALYEAKHSGLDKVVVATAHDTTFGKTG